MLKLGANILAICSTGAFSGLMLAIGLILGGYWRSLPPETFLDWFSTNEMLIARTIPVVAVPAVTGLAASIWLAGSAGRRFWIAALLAIAVLFVVTAIVHLPINAAFAAKSLPPDQVGPAIDRWLGVHWLRIALGFAATALGVAAVARSARAIGSGRNAEP